MACLNLKLFYLFYNELGELTVICQNMVSCNWSLSHNQEVTIQPVFGYRICSLANFTKFWTNYAKVYYYTLLISYHKNCNLNANMSSCDCAVFHRKSVVDFRSTLPMPKKENNIGYIWLNCRFWVNVPLVYCTLIYNKTCDDASCGCCKYSVRQVITKTFVFNWSVIVCNNGQHHGECIQYVTGDHAQRQFLQNSANSLYAATMRPLTVQV